MVMRMSLRTDALSNPAPCKSSTCTHGEGRGLSPGNRHDQEIGASLGWAANHDGGTAFDSKLVRGGKGTKTTSPKS